MKPLQISTGNNGVNALGLPTPASDSVNGVALTASSAESITIPSGAKYVLFNATADFYVAYSGTAAVITDTTDGTGAELNPTLRELKTGDTLSVISAEVCLITASFYS